MKGSVKNMLIPGKKYEYLDDIPTSSRTIQCPVVNTPLRQLTDLFSTLRAIVVGVRREGTLFAPEASDQLLVRKCSELLTKAIFFL